MPSTLQHIPLGQALRLRFGGKFISLGDTTPDEDSSTDDFQLQLGSHIPLEDLLPVIRGYFVSKDQGCDAEIVSKDEMIYGQVSHQDHGLVILMCKYTDTEKLLLSGQLFVRPF